MDGICDDAQELLEFWWMSSRYPVGWCIQVLKVAIDDLEHQHLVLIHLGSSKASSALLRSLLVRT